MQLAIRETLGSASVDTPPQMDWSEGERWGRKAPEASPSRRESVSNASVKRARLREYKEGADKTLIIRNGGG